MSGVCIEEACHDWGLTPWQVAQFLPNWETEPCDCGCRLGWRIHRPDHDEPPKRPVKAITNTVGIPTPRKAQR